ncbi:MAG: amidohydrolase [Sphingomonadaceae bacterium]|nr:amidohydrolase [Sphingomonadaceae bacterium]MCP5382997.1 amidohydrolase [Altererythrobacter sp.]MCP5393180.1 amidohydrolase [Sphingomonadaceae bacterium]
MPVIDVHTHMLSQPWLEDIRQHGAPKYGVKPTAAGQESVYLGGAPFVTLFPEMFDYDLRIANMDKAGVDVAIVSLTCPSAYFGGEQVSTRVAREMNAHMAHQQSRFPDRIRFFATLPWQYAERAVDVLQEAVGQGAVGVFVSANVDGKSLTSPDFAPVWQAIDDFGLPVLVHPTAPQGAAEMEMHEYGLVPPVGFMFDTTLAISRMIFDGFLDRYPNLKIIAAHGGATLPYLAGRLDRCHEMIPACSDVISEKPSSYLQRIYYDAVVYEQDALELCIKVAGGADRVMYGSDYPHNIGDMAGCLGRVNALDSSTAAQVSSGTAEAIFDL